VTKVAVAYHIMSHVCLQEQHALTMSLRELKEVRVLYEQEKRK